MTGYKKPPKHSQFKKGQSGNPKGRPKKPESITARVDDDLRLKVAQRPVKVRDGDEVSEIPAIEAVLNAQLKSALGGNPIAQKEFIKGHGAAVQDTKDKINKENESWRALTKLMRNWFDLCKKQGKPEPIIYPHPDDIVIDDQIGVSFTGPFDEEDAKRVDACLKYREALILQYGLDENRRRKTKKSDPPDSESSALALAQLINNNIYNRFQLSELELISRVLDMRRMTQRGLLKESHRAWAATGAPLPRGARFPPLSLLKRAYAVE